MGGRRLGVRWSSGALASALADLAGPVASGDDVPPNLSVVVGGPRAGTRDKHLLYVQGRQVAAPASDGRLLRAIVRAGAGLVHDAPDDALAVTAVAVARPDGTIVLVDTALRSELHTVRPRLERDGCRVLDATVVAVDPETAHLVVPGAAALWGIDPARLDARFPLRPGDDDLRAVDAPVARIIVATAARPEHVAATVAAAAGLVRDRTGHLRARDVERLARLLERVEPVPYVLTDPAPLLELVTTSSRT